MMMQASPEDNGNVSIQVPRLEFSRIAFFTSHGGSSMRGIVTACGRTLRATPELVVFAKEHEIFSEVVNVQIAGSEENVNQRVMELLLGKQIDLIILSGYMKLLELSIVQRLCKSKVK